MTQTTHTAIALLGSTGSIGRNTLEVVRQNPKRFSVRYLSANQNAELLIAQAKEFHPAAVAIVDENAYNLVRKHVGTETEVFGGNVGVLALTQHEGYDTLVSSLVGFAGMRPTITAIENGKTIALANKETLVVAGEIISKMLDQHQASLIPIDSEHSAVLQCITGETPESISRIILTASGGPFRGKNSDQLRHVSVADALNHPNWSMGSKITIDSATLMNKGLEVIEAHWLFRLNAEKIDVVVHPQSIIHSLVQFSDGSVKAQLGVPDMELPIQYALSYPERLPNTYNHFDLTRMNDLTFEEPDLETFRCLSLAYTVLEQGGTAPAVLNAANEMAVEAFLRGQIGFLDIPGIIEAALEKMPWFRDVDIDMLVEVDAQTRTFSREFISTSHSKIVSLA